MDPREFHGLATELVCGRTPVKIRSSISRAYYGAYNVGVEILGQLGFPVSEGPSGHGEVTRHLLNSGVEDVKTAGSMLGDLRTKRIVADYRMNKIQAENPRTAEALVADADDIIKTLDECLEEPQKSQVIKVIKDSQDRILGASS